MGPSLKSKYFRILVEKSMFQIKGHRMLPVSLFFSERNLSLSVKGEEGNSKL